MLIHKPYFENNKRQIYVYNTIIRAVEYNPVRALVLGRMNATINPRMITAR
jgi:hypothetical protein